MKIIIVMTYFNRPFQLERTLESFKLSKHNNFEVVVMDDDSDEDIQLKEYPFKVEVLKVKKNGWMNGVPAYNIGFNYALSHKPDVIIIQNAECYHYGDVISYAEKVTSTNYLAFSCFSLNRENTFIDHNIPALMEQNARVVTFDGDIGWYNHPVYRNAGYHFCSAITAENLVKINGFDERLSMGIAYEDNCLLHQIKCLGLRLDILGPENPFAVHQWHYDIVEAADRVRHISKNRLIFYKLRHIKYYKAEHIFTKDLHL